MKYLLVSANTFTANKDVFLIYDDDYDKTVNIGSIRYASELIEPIERMSIELVKVKGNKSFSNEIRKQLIYNYKILKVEDI